VIEHLDEAGRPCLRHAPAGVDDEAVLGFAVVGSRASTFHHDCASKLQSLVLALDEVGELAAGNAALLRALETATGAVGELHLLLNINRALTRPAARTKVRLDQLVAAAAGRSHVAVRGKLPASELFVTVPPVSHALALLIDLAAGLDGYNRVADISADGAVVTIVDHGVKVVANATVLVGLAAHALARAGGELRCGAHSFLVRLAQEPAL